MRSTRRRPSRLSPVRPGSGLEELEGRQLLTSYYGNQNGLPFTNLDNTKAPTLTPLTPEVKIIHPIGSDPAKLADYDNEGRYLTGEDRQGNRWTLTLTGPGKIIVTDTTPNDGSLDDDLNTIQLVGTNLAKSRLVGTVQPSARYPTDPSLIATQGQVKFNRLIAQGGVHGVELNGFVLTDTVFLPGGSRNATTGISLHGGTYRLSLQAIDASSPATANPQPITVSIGDPTSPLTIKPSVYIDRIINTVYNDANFTTAPASVALTNPSVIVSINGEAGDLNFVSIGQETDLAKLQTLNGQFLVSVPPLVIPSDTAATAYRFPTVATTGRTSIQVKGVNNVKINGSATNVTVSRSATPFANSLTGVTHVKRLTIGGVNDAVGIDSRGNIGGVKFARGFGNPTNNKKPATNYGIPNDQNGYAANGYLGGQIVTEGSIGHIVAAPATRVLLVPQDPNNVQPFQNGTIDYGIVPGTTFTTALITAAGSIGGVTVVGDATNTEIRSGYNYYSGIGGIEGVSGASSIGPVSVRGSLIDSVFSASYRAVDGIYGNGNDSAGPGVITGRGKGYVIRTATGTTALGNRGAGFYAAAKSKGLPSD